MVWLNPWAWLGLLTLALPVLAHLLARPRPRRLRFPTLRFLGHAAPLAGRRSRPTDPLLLAVRLAVLATAVAALARPWLPTRERGARTARAVARAVVVDTSWSMIRPTPTGELALEAARRLAEQAEDGAIRHARIETAVPGAALPGAVAWLGGARAGLKELWIVSDFQVGSVDLMDLAEVPPEVGLRLLRVELAAGASPPGRVVTHGAWTTEVRATVGPSGTGAEWIRRPSSEDGVDGLLLLHGDDEASGVAAALRAAEALAAPAVDPARPVAVAWPAFPGRPALVAAAQPPAAPWIGDVTVRLARHPNLREAATDAVPAPGVDPPPPPFVAVARNRSGEPVVAAAQARIDGAARLLVLPLVEGGSLVSAALLTALGEVAGGGPPLGEDDAEGISEPDLAAWQRPAAQTSMAPGLAGGPDDSDGRWVWLAVLGLLGVEGALRRRTGARGP